MTDDKDIFDDADFLAPPEDEEVIELDGDHLDEVEELTEADETVTSVDDFSDIDLDDPVELAEEVDAFEDLEDIGFGEDSDIIVAEEEPADLFDDSEMEESTDQQTFGFEEPETDIDSVELGDETIMASPAKPKKDKNKLIVVGVIILLVLAGGIAAIFMTGSDAPVQPVQVANDWDEQDIDTAADSMAAAGTAVTVEESDVGDQQIADEAEPEMVEPEPVAEPEPIVQEAPVAVAPQRQVQRNTVAGKSAEKIVDIIVDSAEGVDTITFEFDGDAPQKIRSFTLREDPRYVVDFYGVQKLDGRQIRDIWQGKIKKVRSGRHPDKMRVVVELESADVSIKRSTSGNKFVLTIK